MDPVGMVQLSDIQAKIASGQFMPMSSSKPVRGDFVILKP
jgi:hypothetical protein